MPVCHRLGVLQKYNDYRARHGAPPLQWSEECAAHAQRCADESAEHHRPWPSFLIAEASGRQMGQSIYLGGGPAENAVQTWYEESEKRGYNFDRPGPQEGTSDFTAIVWCETTHVGMARSRCGTFLVANYFPAGNCGGSEGYRRNVLGPTLIPPTFRPRNAVEQRLLGHFLRIAEEKSRRHLTDNKCKVPRRTIFEILWHMGEKLLAEAMLSAKTDRDGCIVADEFMTVCCGFRPTDHKAVRDLERRLARVAGIVAADEDGDCKLDRGEFARYLLGATGRGWPAPEVQQLLEEFDGDGDGLIDYQELLALHDAGAIERPGSSVLIEHWGPEAERLLEGIPLAPLISKLRCHVVHGQTARVARSESSVLVKLISRDSCGQLRYQSLRGEWGPQQAPSPQPRTAFGEDGGGAHPPATLRDAAAEAKQQELCCTRLVAPSRLAPLPRGRTASNPCINPRRRSRAAGGAAMERVASLPMRRGGRRGI